MSFNYSSREILVVEDALIAKKVAQAMLKRLNCKVDFASSGLEALDLIAKNDYDMIFMDLGLPDMDGVAVTEKIRGMKEKKGSVPIIALSANFDDECRAYCLKAGMNEFIAKPLTKENVYYLSDKFLSKKSF